RGSLLIWKLFGRRTDGQGNDEPPPAKPGEKKPEPRFAGGVMPPPEAVKEGKVKPLSDEDRLTLIRWIDLGCPIDLTYERGKPEPPPGWLAHRTLPTLPVAAPPPGVNGALTRILIGADDRYSGLAPDSLRVVADFAVDGVPAGDNLAPKLK